MLCARLIKINVLGGDIQELRSEKPPPASPFLATNTIIFIFRTEESLADYIDQRLAFNAEIYFTN